LFFSVSSLLCVIPLPPSSPLSVTHRVAAAIALGLLTLAAYSNSFSAGFPFDNKQLILQDPRVHEASAANVDLILQHSYWWPYGESGLYRPVTTLSYLFNYAVLGNGERAAGYHAFNLAAHTINVLMVCALMLRLLGPAKAGPFVAFATAAIWAVHPLSTEAVTNIVGRADLLAAMAVLGAFLMYLNGRAAAGWRRLAWFSGLSAVSALGFFSKESAVVIVPVIVLDELAWWDHGRSPRALLWAAVALGLPLLLMWSQRTTVLGSAPAAEFAFVDNPIVGAGFWTGRLTAVGVMARYLALLVWPATLSSDYSYQQIQIFHGTPGDWIACAAIAAIVFAALALWRLQKNPPFIRATAPAAFFAAFAFITFLPASNLLFPTGTIMAERLMYLPSLGLVALFTIGLVAAAHVLDSRHAALVVVALIVGGLSYRTWLRNPAWANDISIWTSAVAAAPDSAKAHRALAEALYDSDPTHQNLDRVIAEAERSVSLLSAVPDRWNSYHDYRQAAAYHLDKADGLRRRAAAGEANAAAEAARATERSLALVQRCLAIIKTASASIAGASVAPEADAQRLLAAALLGLDDTARALDAATRARQLDPLTPLAYRLGADALLGQRRPDEAAVTLMVGSIVTDDAGLGQALMGLYRSGFDQQGCAVTSSPQGPMLNPSCPIVRAHFCAASAQAIELNLRLGRPDRADRGRAFAAQEFGCR
jgi:hypothetical protein